MIEKEEDILEQLQKYPNEVLVKLYKDYRKEFLSWAYKSFSADEDSASDCFQDAMIVLYRNVQERKLTELQSSIKTYLFSVGKNLLLRNFKSESRMIPLNETAYRDVTFEETEYRELYSGNMLENKIADIVETLRDPCKSILRFFYFRGFSMEEIAEEMNITKISKLSKSDIIYKIFVHKRNNIE